VHGAAAALREGGVAVISVGWAHDGTDAWAEPRRWLDEGRCDAIVLRVADLDPLSNAWSFTRDADTSARWADALNADGIAAVAYGAVLLRRRAAGGRVVTLDLAGLDIPTAGRHVRRMLGNLGWLAEHEAGVAHATFAAAEGLELRRVEQLGPALDDARPVRLALRRGLPVTVEADDALVAAVRRGSVDGDESLVPAVTRLLEAGLLTPSP
jgi:hypothetical protein